MAWGLEHISSRELSEWIALAQVEAKEDERRKDLADSGDGVVIVANDPDADEEEDDGEAE